MFESGDTILKVRNLSRHFDIRRGIGRSRRLHAVTDVSLSVKKGQVLGLVGESGCGKSTLAKMILGLLPPSSGSITVGGKPVSQYKRKDLARIVQPIFQDPFSSLNPKHSIEEIVGLPLILHRKLGRAEIRRGALETLELVGLPSRTIDALPSQLSGGQRQRVAIARALMARPEIIICDEPTSALDVSVQAQILNLLSDLRRELDLTYLLISHDLSVVEYMSDSIAVMYLGRIVEEGSADAVFRAPRHPYAETLLESALPIAPGAGIPDTRLGATTPNPFAVPEGCAFHPRCHSAQNPACMTNIPKLAGGGGLHRAACHFPRNQALTN